MSSHLTEGISFRFLEPLDAPPLLLQWILGRRSRLLPFDVWNTRIEGLPYEAVQMLRAVRHVPRMSSCAVAVLLWRLVDAMPSEHQYVNVGTWHGYSLLAGMIGHLEKRCIGVDNFSQFNPGGATKRACEARFKKHASPLHCLYEADYTDYFARLHQGSIGVYFYDGWHSEEDQYNGMVIAEPFFSDHCIIVIDDANWAGPRDAANRFLSERPGKYQVLLDQPTAGNCHPTWWNGLLVLQKCL